MRCAWISAHRSSVRARVGGVFRGKGSEMCELTREERDDRIRVYSGEIWGNPVFMPANNQPFCKSVDIHSNFQYYPDQQPLIITTFYIM